MSFRLATLGLSTFLFLAPASISSTAAAKLWDPPSLTPFNNIDELLITDSGLTSIIERGREIFQAQFNILDGAGRPGATGDSKPTPRFVTADHAFNRISGPDALACSSCHNQPIMGGSGDFVTNVFVGAHKSDPPLLSIESSKTNERNTTNLLGSGLIEAAAKLMTDELTSAKRKLVEEAIVNKTMKRREIFANGTSFGFITAYPDGRVNTSEVVGVDYDLVVRPFGAKGVTASLREFTIAALNQHHGIQAIERFGWERTGIRDFDGDGVVVELNTSQVTALVLFQAALPAPEPWYPNELIADANVGLKIFDDIGCSQCHKRKLRTSGKFVEPNPYNRPGTAKKADLGYELELSISETADVFSDLKRHNVCDSFVSHFCNENVKQDNVGLNQFITAKLWDLGTSAPYGHRGDLYTISEAILAHGGEAAESRVNFEKLTDNNKKTLIAFLSGLGKGSRNQADLLPR